MYKYTLSVLNVWSIYYIPCKWGFAYISQTKIVIKLLVKAKKDTYERTIK